MFNKAALPHEVVGDRLLT